MGNEKKQNWNWKKKIDAHGHPTDQYARLHSPFVKLANTHCEAEMVFDVILPQFFVFGTIVIAFLSWFRICVYFRDWMNQTVKNREKPVKIGLNFDVLTRAQWKEGV